MINLKPEIKLPLSAVLLIGIIVSLLFADKLGIFSAICFSLACLVLFVVIVIMPRQLKEKLINLQNQYHPIYRSIFLEKKGKLEAVHQRSVNSWFGFAVFLLVLGIILYLVVR
jgi:uncharacterized membrane protein (DUF373 family)